MRKRDFGEIYRCISEMTQDRTIITSEEVTLLLVKSKCVPVLLYGLEVCELNKSQMASLDFTINRFFMKLFSTSNMEIVKSCQEFFALNYLALCCPNA